MTYRILLTGGGSGGHLFPLIAVAEELQRQAAKKGVNLELQFLGDTRLIRSIIGNTGIKFKEITSPKWRRYTSVNNFIDILKAPVGFLQALFYVWKYMPDIIFAKGGYDSFLPSIVGKLMMIPIAIHESDVVPGKANVHLSKLASKIFISFEASQKYFKGNKVLLTGNPIRGGILSGSDRISALSGFSLNPEKPTVLITGASQGAKIINDTLLLAIVELVKNFQVIHQSGPNNYDEVNRRILEIVKEGEGNYGKEVQENYRLYPLFDLDQMAMAYAAADVIVSRAGAGSIFEIAAVGKPAVIIPLKNSANNHQLANAREFTKFGAIIIEEDNLTSHILINEIKEAYKSRAERSEKIKEFAITDAAAKIADNLLSFA